MWIKTRLVVFLLVPSIAFSAESQIDFLDVSFLEKIQTNSTPSIPPHPDEMISRNFTPKPPASVVISWMEKPPYVMFDEEPLETSENRTRLASSKPGEAMNETNNNGGIIKPRKRAGLLAWIQSERYLSGNCI